MTDRIKLYPVTIHRDRYGDGWKAFFCSIEDMPEEIGGGDAEHMYWFIDSMETHCKDGVVWGRGETPNEALADLEKNVRPEWLDLDPCQIKELTDV